MKMKRIPALILPLLFASLLMNAQTKVRFYTNNGNFDADLYDVWQPITAGNFKSLVNAKFYDGILIHRVVAGFVIQGGDPNGNGTGGPGYTIPDEFDPNTSNVQKAISMANAGPNTGGSQFFINLVNNTNLDPNYPVFGIVTSNFNIVQAIGAVAVDANDKPLVDVVMDSIRVINAPAATSDLQLSDILVEVSPNPVSSRSFVSVQSNETAGIRVSLSSMYGTELFSTDRRIDAGISRFSFSELGAADLARGIYLLRIEQGKSVYRKKIIVGE